MIQTEGIAVPYIRAWRCLQLVYRTGTGLEDDGA